jgi:bifunctional ADP-heptose synthase (sugar kinase/adenylyltransferase)
MRERIKNKNILVIGDTIFDKTVNVEATGISLESPTLKGNYKNEQLNIGGAGNVVKYLKLFGCNVTFLTAIAKHDESLFANSCNKLINLGTQSNTKTRFWVSKQEEKYKYLQINDCGNTFISNIDLSLLKENYDLIYISDYRCGLISDNLIQEIQNLPYKLFVSAQLSDKKEKFFKYTNYHTAIVNEDEYNCITNNKKSNYIITLGKNGCKSIKNNKEEMYPGYPVITKNVIGAGDAFAAAYIATECCDYANRWASYIVSADNKNNISLDGFYAC